MPAHLKSEEEALAQAPLGIIGAMEVEVEELVSAMDVESILDRARSRYYQGTLEGMPVVVVRSGVGKVRAGACTQVLVDEFGVRGIINTGIAGAVSNKLHLMDVVVSSTVGYHDVDVSALGEVSGEVYELAYSNFPADEKLKECALQAARSVLSEQQEGSGEAADSFDHVHEGPIVSGDVFVADANTKECLRVEYQALCCEMEGAAIAHVASINERPFVVVRTISDAADGDAKMSYTELEQASAHLCASVVKEMLKNL